MNKLQILKKRADYVAVYEQGKGWGDNLVMIKVLSNGLDWSRFGFSVGKEVGKAVKRNRVRRWLKEIARQVTVKPGWDIVFIVRPEVVKADYHQLRESVTKLLNRAKLMVDSETVNSGIN